MKTIPSGLQTALDTGATTLCTCWRIVRADGVVYGFTNHDRTLNFGGVSFEPGSGFTGSEINSSLGLAVDGGDVEGALSSLRITDNDIALGLWDNAACEVWRVDWSNTANRVITRKGSLGEISRGDVAYQSEIRSLAHELNQEQGRSYGRLCDALLGDKRCRINATDPRFSAAGTVTGALEDRIITVSGLAGYSEGWFASGLLTWTGGVNSGAKIEIRSHFIESGNVRLTLWQKAALPVSIGNTLSVVAGCDKKWATCKAKFGNAVNFRGKPHIPGNDFALSIAKRSGLNDGGSFFS